MQDGIKKHVFTGWLNNGQTVTETIYSLPGWTSSILRVTIVVQDVNSNTSLRFFCADYGWYRSWDEAPKCLELARQFDYQQGDAKYRIESSAKGDDIQIKISQTGLTVATKYKIAAEWMTATSECEINDTIIHNRARN